MIDWPLILAIAIILIVINLVMKLLEEFMT